MNPIGRISQAHTPRRLAWRRTHAVYGASTSVYKSTRNTAQAQNLNRTIHCVTFANSSEIDLQARGAELHTIWRNKHDLLVANTTSNTVGTPRSRCTSRSEPFPHENALCGSAGSGHCRTCNCS